MTMEQSWFSFVPRPHTPPVGTTPPKSLHDWEEKFFYVKRRVIPVDMPWKVVAERQRVPDHPVMEGFREQAWFKDLVAHASPFDTGMCSEAMLALLGMSRVQLVEGKEPVVAAPGVLLYSGMSKFNAFLARDKAPLEWIDSAVGRVSVIDQMVDRFYFPYLEFKPSGMIISREHPINPNPLCSVPHVTTPYFVVSFDEESTGSSVELVHPPPPRGRKKSTPRAHKHKVLSQVKSAPLSACGEGPYFGQREGRVESSSSAPEDVDVPETPLKKKRKLGKVQSGKSGSSRSKGSGGAGPAPFTLEISPPPERRPLIQKTVKKVTIVSPQAPGSSSGPTPSEALAEAEKARAEKEAAEAEKRANEAAAKKAEAEKVAAEKLRLEEIAKKAEEEKAFSCEKAEAEAKAKSDEEATRVASKQVLSESSPGGGSDTGVVGQVGLLIASRK
ncbi:hypothetical protein M8C21_022220, partial [Ambrosia artemisiifolia]